MWPLLALIVLAAVIARVHVEAAARKPTIRSVGIDMLHITRHTVRYLLDRLPSWGAAAMCVMFTVYLTLLFSVPAFLVRIAGGVVPHPALAALAAVAGAVLSFYAGLVLSRTLLRALPSRLSGRRRKGVLTLLVFIALVELAMVVAVVAPRDQVRRPDSSGTPAPQVAPWEARIDRAMAAPAFGLSNVIGLGAFGVGVLLPVFLRHLRPRVFLHRPFVLFLRRFSTFSDRAVIATLLRATPPGTPVVFLTPTRSRPADWNPFMVALSGFKLRRPIRSMPIILLAADQNWEGAAHELIDRATHIVLDVSDPSRAIDIEIDMIARGRRQPSTLLLHEGRQPEGGATRDTTGWPGTSITYERSWRRALPRLGFGVLATAILLAATLVVIVFPEDPVDMPLQEQLRAVAAYWTRWTGWSAVPLLAAAVWIYYTLFVRPAMDRGAHRALVAVLRREPQA